MPALTLERLLASLGFGSRKEARALVRMGLVKLGGEVMADPFLELASRPEFIEVNGERVPTIERLYGMLHKPLGYECSARPMHHESVFSLLPERFVAMNIRTVGRLDVETSGLLLFSNDGGFIHHVESPKKGVTKLYRATLARPLEPGQEAALRQGVMLKGERAPVTAKSLKLLSETEVELEISEGLYHQVRRMFAAVGNHIEALTRLAIGGLALPKNLEPAAYRLLDLPEVLALGYTPES